MMDGRLNRGGILRWGLLALVVSLGGMSCAPGGGDKIPVTTRSPHAREDYLTGRDLLERLRFPEAREYFERAVAEDSTFALAWLHLAQVSTSARQFVAGLEQARRHMAGASEGEQLLIKAAVAGRLEADYTEQERLLRRLVELYPRDERAHAELGNFFFFRQRWQEAIDEYKTAIKIAPYYSPPYNQLGYAYRYLERWELAEKAFEEYTRIIPDDPNPYDSYAELLLKRGKLDQAIESYRRALAIDSGFIASYLGLATCFMLKGDYGAAHRELDVLLERATDDSQRRAALFGSAVVFVDEGLTDSALARCKALWAVSSSGADTIAMATDRAFAARILLEAGRFGRAREAIAETERLVAASSLPESRKSLSERLLLVLSGRLAVAEGDLETARRIERELQARVEAGDEQGGNPEEARRRHELAGLIALAAGDYGRAVEELSQADQQDAYVLFRLGEAYEGMDDRVNARLMYDRAANFNAVLSISQAFIRRQAVQRLAGL